MVASEKKGTVHCSLPGRLMVEMRCSQLLESQYGHASLAAWCLSLNACLLFTDELEVRGVVELLMLQGVGGGAGTQKALWIRSMHPYVYR